MFNLLLNQKCIAKSALESGDPPMGCVSGLLVELGDIQTFSDLLIKLGGVESDGEYRLELNSSFEVLGPSDKQLQYSGGCIMAYPELDEVVIDLVGIAYPEYGVLFPEHVKAYDRQFDGT